MNEAGGCEEPDYSDKGKRKGKCKQLYYQPSEYLARITSQQSVRTLEKDYSRLEIGKDHLIAKITAEGEIDARWCSGKREARRLYAIL